MPSLAAGRHIVVTGSTGFIGSTVVRSASRAGARVTAVARTSSDPWRLEPVAGIISVVREQLAALTANCATIEAVDAVIHCAAEGVNQRFDDLDQMIATNVVGTVAALRFAASIRARRFVMLGTSGEYGPGQNIDENRACAPTSEYGATRAGATMIARAFGNKHGLDVVVVRPFAVYGPYEAPYRLMPHAVVAGLRGEPIRISSGEQTRDYVFADDVADGILRAALLPEAKGGVFNLCTGVDTSVRDAATIAAELTGRGSRVDAGAIEGIPGEMWKTSGNPSRARSTLGWTATHDLRSGLLATIDWFRATGLRLPQYSAG